MLKKEKWWFRAGYKLLDGILLTLFLSVVGYVVHPTSQSDIVYTTEIATVGVLEKTVTSLGSLQPKDYVDIGAQVSG